MSIDRRSFLKIGTIDVVSGLAQNVFGSVLSPDPAAPLANLSERRLSFYNLHTAETLNTVYWTEGEYLPESLDAINNHLRDYRTGDVREIDRRLLDLLCGLRLKLE